MFEFTRNFYILPGVGDEGGSEPSFTPGLIIIPEQTVETLSPMESADPSAALVSDYSIGPNKLLINFDGTDYEVKVLKDKGFYNYDCYLGESDGRLFRIILFPPQGWSIVTPSQGTYTVSAKIPEEKSPKVFTFPKGRTIISELSRLNKAFGTVSKKKTIIGQLSDLADAAEAGKIGGGSSGALMVHAYSDGMAKVLDKTWQEIYDALKITSVYIITETEDEEGMSVSTNRRLVGAWYSNGTYGVSDDDSWEFKTDSSDGYPKRTLQFNPGGGEMS